MKSLKKSQFLAEVYWVALGVNNAIEQHLRHNPKDERDFLEKYYTFTQLSEREVVGKSHGWVQGEGYSKECPIAQAVLFLARLKRREDMVPMKEVAGNAMILLEFTERAWEEYTILLADYEQAKQGLLVGLHAIAAENSARAGLSNPSTPTGRTVLYALK